MEETTDSKPTNSPPPQQEPDLKRPKMSTTTTTSDDEDAATTIHGGDSTTTNRKQKYKRRKIAIFFAYCGVGYQGMQKNPGAKTIEGDLEEALFHAGAVPEHDRGNPKRYDWARSARTDKGVSAVGQVVSGRFYIDPPGLVERLNANLSPQIRIFGYKRVTGSYSAKKFCDRRRYVYLIPVFALDPSSHRDRESVLASLGSGDELVKCVECSERGRKVVGAVGNKRDLKSVACLTGISSNGLVASVKNEIIEDNGTNGANSGSQNEDTENPHVNVKIKEESVEKGCDDETRAGVLMEDLKVSVEEERVNAEEEAVKRSNFCYGEKEKERFNRILSYYVGSHNFHNFTTRTNAEDPAARRYIVSFDANVVVTVEGIEFVKCEIRKMMGVAVAIMRNCAPELLIQTALQKDVNINVPTAPECFFTSYNRKWKDTHEELSMKDYEAEAEEFKMKHIYSHIASTEHKEGSVGLWLHSLNNRNYPDLRIGNSGDKDGKESKGAEKIADDNNITMAVDWADLPPELLHSISQRLPVYSDYLRFRAVCRAWRSSTPRTPHHLPAQLPWLLLPKSRRNQSRRAFFDLSARSYNLFHLPEIAHNSRHCGSSHGWLVILDDSPSVLLLNPLTRAKVYLPPLSAFPVVVSFNYSDLGREYVFYNESGNLCTRSLRQMRDLFIKKVVLSSSPLHDSYAAVAILNQTGDLVYCKNGDASWKLIEQARYFCEDVVYINGLFYAVNKTGQIAACDVSGDSPMVSFIKTPAQIGGDMQYLVGGSGDELLLVTRYLDIVVEHGNLFYSFENLMQPLYRTTWFAVFRLEFGGGPRWEKMSSLGGRVLFIGENSSLSLSVSGLTNCSGDCVYYTDDYSETNYDGHSGEHDVGIFKLWDGSIDPLPCYPLNSHCHLQWPPPVWTS
ncbi:hypothetical protein Tsubulata_045751, partial [Turnera subulata]